jgi:capsule polysaccharide export protein KpsC/LpsZ
MSKNSYSKRKNRKDETEMTDQQQSIQATVEYFDDVSTVADVMCAARMLHEVDAACCGVPVHLLAMAIKAEMASQGKKVR